MNILARLSEVNGRWSCRIIRPDLGTFGYGYVEVREGTGTTREESIMDLQMKVAGDDFETVKIRFV